MDEELEELRREVARLSTEVDMVKTKVRICIETLAKLREELESLRRKARRPSLKGYVEALRAYDEVEAGEREPP